MIAEHMSAQTCAIVAQTMPVFLVALVAERIAFKSSKDVRDMSRRVLAVVTRIAVDLAIAAGLIGLTAAALIGVEDGGLHGDLAELAWIGSLILTIAIVYRWLLLSTPLPALWQQVAAGWVALLASVFGSLILNSASLGTVRLVGVVAKPVTWLSEIAFGVVSGGVATAVDKLSQILSDLIRAAMSGGRRK